MPQAKYFNLYGPTETNVITYHEVVGLDADRVEPVPIGKVCANMEVFALTDDGRRVSGPGERGELYARGSCVAQGYWGDADKTRRGFLPNGQQPAFEERAYRTGDLVTLDEQGNWIYLGRLDHMIKSRGYRIELGEIETALYGHPEVEEAAVVAVPDELVTNRIKAYVVPRRAGGLTVKELQRFCVERIPRHMVPEQIEARRCPRRERQGRPPAAGPRVRKRRLATPRGGAGRGAAAGAQGARAPIRGRSGR